MIYAQEIYPYPVNVPQTHRMHTYIYHTENPSSISTQGSAHKTSAFPVAVRATHAQLRLEVLLDCAPALPLVRSRHCLMNCSIGKQVEVGAVQGREEILTRSRVTAAFLLLLLINACCAFKRLHARNRNFRHNFFKFIF